MGQFVSIQKTMRMRFPLHHLCLNDTCVSPGKSICCEGHWVLCWGKHPLPARQCEQPEPVHEIHNTQANRQWNEGHSAETTDQMLPWYTFTMVHLILSKPLWRQRDRHASAYVPMYFFLFFPRPWESFNWQIQDCPSHHPWIFMVFESLKGRPFLQGILSSPDKALWLAKNKFPNRDFTGLSSLLDTERETIAFYKQ